MQESVNLLSPKNRAVTFLFYYEQLSQQEIAIKLGISVVAVKSRLHQARKELRERLDGKMLSFDNMQDRPIVGTTDWQKYEVILDVPEDGAQIAIGIVLSGKGQVWLSNVQFEIVSSRVPTTS